MRILVPDMQVWIFWRNIVCRIQVTNGASFQQFAVQMDHMAASRPFVQVVDVLCNDMDVEFLFQVGKSDMSGIRFRVQ